MKSRLFLYILLVVFGLLSTNVFAQKPNRSEVGRILLNSPSLEEQKPTADKQPPAEDFELKMKLFLSGLKKSPDTLERSDTDMSYKRHMFQEDERWASDKLESLIKNVPLLLDIPSTRRMFNLAESNLSTSWTWDDSQTVPAARLSNQELREKWEERVENTDDKISLNEVNPFTLPGIQDARIILLGELHTYQYPAEQMVKHLLEYNQTVPEEQQIKYLFVEYAFQGNLAMKYIREHLNEMPEPALLRNAIEYSKQQMRNYYIDDPEPRNTMHWLHLGYLLLKAGSDVTFYAYDRPSPDIAVRNLTAYAVMDAFYQAEKGKAVFIGGSAHMVRYNIDDPMFSWVNAQTSLANIPTIAKEEIASVFMLGGQPWRGSSYDSPADSPAQSLDNEILDEYRSIPGDWALKTDPELFGFDYYFIFDQSKEADVARLSR